ncbi:hypothetical protein TVAG_063840 [Trichomonas vaginalis G3]|uniref:DUF3447 domain-containing protein n=1 Tax=Trichomonas vaginalis (strain ATCC PRA-98 / G3) TaxID=412133 RepID=A2FG85_TRIV3|nr:spectrin binding [Trichomonas vaginalis G3]EAX96081.1 hypothetical protein TVAG_063840 [Trichomonas vaginalis G3]KAI5528547.1 spectrin binding [Trichomonas vaginalis G3]|eukprot:XP_001309011.1 hypothetical protein [Trichomonas vaginalis G3]
MCSKYLKQYEEFIGAYEKIFHIKSDESIEDVYNLVITVLISKYQVRISDLILSLAVAIKYNYRSIDIYVQILNKILTKYSITRLPDDPLTDYLAHCNLELVRDADNIFQIKLTVNSFPKEDDVKYFIMYDQIDKFKEYTTQNPLDDIEINIPLYSNIRLLEACAYYGSANIFNFLISNFHCEITQKCFQLSLIGGNTDIINECLKHYEIDSACFDYIVASHNNNFLKYIFDRDLYELQYFNFEELIYAQNLKAVFLMYEKDKNSIIPWCAGFSQTLDLIKTEDLNLSNTTDRSYILHYAVKFNNINIVKFILESLDKFPIDINFLGIGGKTALYCAATNNNKEIAELLISYGAEINDCGGSNPLDEAASHNSLDVAKLLIMHGADVNSNENEDMETALHWATIFDYKEMVDLLLSHGADPNKQDRNMMSPLHLAVYKNQKDIAEVLLSHGADPTKQDSNKSNPLQYAVSKNDKNLVEIIINHGINVNLNSYEGENAIRTAVLFNNKEITELLLLHGVNVNSRKGKAGKAILHYLFEKRNIDMIELILSHGANVNIKEKYTRNTCLHQAVNDSFLEGIEILLLHGAKLDPQNK